MSGQLTVAGWVGNTPVVTVAASGRRYTNVRVATTHRYRNEKQEWVDGDTQWYSIRFWDAAADNVAASLHSGQPVIASGRPALEQWESEDGPRAGLTLRGATIGHDLTRGRATFARYLASRDDGENAGGFAAVAPGTPDRFAQANSSEGDPDQSSDSRVSAKVDAGARASKETAEPSPESSPESSRSGKKLAALAG